MDIFDYIINLLPEGEDEQREMIKTGYIYHPYVPLQISHIIPKEKEEEKDE